MDKRAELREKSLKDLQQAGVLMLNGHFDYGNGYHGSVYLNPHQLFRNPSRIWRFAQDLIDVIPSELLQSTQVVAGPATGGALLAHTLAGLLDSRRSLTHPAVQLRAHSQRIAPADPPRLLPARGQGTTRPAG
jgi:orotate phosphoribosyltransferase